VDGMLVLHLTRQFRTGTAVEISSVSNLPESKPQILKSLGYSAYI
jgi:hypothetical protein